MPATDFTLPELGENIAGGDVVRVLGQPGDSVTKDQPVLELETDKATIEVPSSVSGTVKEVQDQAGRAGQGRAGRPDARRRRGAGQGRREGGSRRRPTRPKAEGQRAAPAARRKTSAGLSQEAPPKRSSRRQRRPASPDGTEAEARRSRRHQRRRRGARRRRHRRPEPNRQGPAAPAAPSVRRLARELGVDIRRVAGSGRADASALEDVQAFVRNALGRRRCPAGARRRRCPTSASGARSSASR